MEAFEELIRPLHIKVFNELGVEDTSENGAKLLKLLKRSCSKREECAASQKNTRTQAHTHVSQQAKIGNVPYHATAARSLSLSLSLFFVFVFCLCFGATRT